MEITEIVAVASVVIALFSVAVQQHLTRQQSKAEARVRHYDRTQALIFKALEDPELLEALSGGSPENQKQRRYRQLWFNHVELIFRQRRVFDCADWKVTISDISSFCNMAAMQAHWERYQQFYTVEFRDFMNTSIMKKAEPPHLEAPLEKETADS